jgi:tellurite resistance protein TehA-like permease
MSASHAPSASHWRDWCRGRVATLYPGYFALVMATGIIANAMFFEGQRVISDAMLAINVVAYGVLLTMTVARVVCFPRAVWSDLTEPRLVFAFFTLVAATDVLGAGLSLRGFSTLSLAMWIGALLVWLALIYLSFAILIFFNTAARADIIFGGWLIAIVATEAVAIHGVVVAPSLGAAAPYVMIFGHMLWGIGVVLYAIFIVLFAQRIFFSDVQPQHLTPMLWVVMGAAAISTNAGALLIVTNVGVPFLAAMRPFVDGVDPAARRLRHLDARRASPVARLHAAVLEPGVPARHVCARKPAAVACRRCIGACRALARDGVDRARGLARHVRGVCRDGMARVQPGCDSGIRLRRSVDEALSRWLEGVALRGPQSPWHGAAATNGFPA